MKVSEMKLEHIQVGAAVLSHLSKNSGIIVEVSPNSGRDRDYWEHEVTIEWSGGNKTCTPYVALDKVEYLGKVL